MMRRWSWTVYREGFGSRRSWHISRYLGNPWRTSVIISCNPAKIRTWIFPNTSPEQIRRRNMDSHSLYFTFYTDCKEWQIGRLWRTHIKQIYYAQTGTRTSGPKPWPPQTMLTMVDLITKERGLNKISCNLRFGILCFIIPCLSTVYDFNVMWSVSVLYFIPVARKLNALLCYFVVLL
jgi:hypothetical protein